MTNFLNMLTVSRILLGIVIFLFLYLHSYYWLALIFFTQASLTDFLDGYLARKTGNTSVLGEILDPIADKLLIVFVLIGLSLNLSSFYVGFFASMIIAREIWVAALRDYNARSMRSDRTKVTFLAKIKTTVQMGVISIYLFGLAMNNMMVLLFADILLLLVFLITLQTGLQYTYQTFKK